jgi:hypothetical protein
MDTNIVPTSAHAVREVTVPKKIKYRKMLLQAIEAFLEGTPSALVRAQRMIQRCYTSLGDEDEQTLNSILWRAFITPLTDSIFYEHEPFLRETRELLLGSSSHHIDRTIFREDYRASFTKEEEHWYAQLASMLEFIDATPFTKIHEATNQAWQQKATWPTVRSTLPEAVLADKIDEEYWQRKALLEQIAASNLTPKDIGEQHISHLLLQEITSILTAISVGRAAIAYGYPALDPPYTIYNPPVRFEEISATEQLIWAKNSLEALAGEREIFISWRLGRASTFDGAMLLVFFH